MNKMGNILGAYLLPHPPIILEEIGRGEEKKAKATISGMERASKDIKSKAPSTIVIVTPHGPLFRDAISISVEEKLKGDFARFGHGELKFQYENNLDLVDQIIKNARQAEISVIEVNKANSRLYNMEEIGRASCRERV